MEVEEVEEAGEPVVERVGVVLGGAPVSGAGPGADTGGDREPESGQVVAQAEVGEPVGVEGGRWGPAPECSYAGWRGWGRGLGGCSAAS